MLQSGKCELCKIYEAVVGEGKECEIPTCGEREKVHDDGHCVDCEEYERQ